MTLGSHDILTLNGNSKHLKHFTIIYNVHSLFNIYIFHPYTVNIYIYILHKDHTIVLTYCAFIIIKMI